MWWDVCEYENEEKEKYQSLRAEAVKFNFFIYFYSKVYEVKLVKVCWFLFFPPTHQSPQQNVLVVGHDQDDVAGFCTRSRTPDATGEQRWQQHCDGCGGSSPPASGSSGSDILDCHRVTSAPPNTHTNTHWHTRTHAHSCLAAFVSSGGKVVARWTHTQSLRKWSWSYDQRGGGGVAAQNTVYKSGLLNFYTIHSVNQRVF